MKIIKYAIIAMSLLWFNAATFSITDADLLHQYLSRIRTFEAQFKQEVRTSKDQLKQQISGKFVLQKPNQFVWQINQPHVQKLISNGQVLWIYQPALKQVIKKSIHNNFTKTPIEFLSGSSRELSYYFHISSMKQGNELSFLLRPKDKKMAFQSMEFVFQGNQLKYLNFEDSLGQSVEIQFYNIRQNIAVSPDLFQFVPPQGVDIVQREKR